MNFRAFLCDGLLKSQLDLRWSNKTLEAKIMRETFRSIWDKPFISKAYLCVLCCSSSLLTCFSLEFAFRSLTFPILYKDKTCDSLKQSKFCLMKAPSLYKWKNLSLFNNYLKYLVENKVPCHCELSHSSCLFSTPALICFLW